MQTSPPRRPRIARVLLSSLATAAFTLLMLTVGGVIHPSAPGANPPGALAAQHASAPAARASVALVAPALATEAPPAGIPPIQRALSLADAGRFEEAAAVARTAPEELRAAALSSVFSRWAGERPTAAAAAALALADDAQRNLVWHVVATRWAEIDPAALALFGWSLPRAPERSSALDIALARWIERDETAALDWVGSLPSSRASDSAVAMIAGHSSLIGRDPELALCWAETINDLDLRSRTLAAITRAWLPAAPEAAARYARQSPDIFPAHREDILVGERFTAHP